MGALLPVGVFLVALCMALRKQKLREKQNKRLRAKQGKDWQRRHEETEEGKS